MTDEMNLDDPDRSLESLVRSVPLREPGDDLEARVRAAFHQSRRSRFGFYPIALAASVLLALAIGVRLALPKPHPGEIAAVQPIQIERVTSTVYDDGVIASTDDAAYRQLHRRTVREIWTIDPKSHSRSVVAVPAEQILIQKVDAF
jgi:hypothetical protein